MTAFGLLVILAIAFGKHSCPPMYLEHMGRLSAQARMAQHSSCPSASVRSAGPTPGLHSPGTNFPIWPKTPWSLPQLPSADWDASPGSPAPLDCRQGKWITPVPGDGWHLPQEWRAQPSASMGLTRAQMLWRASAEARHSSAAECSWVRARISHQHRPKPLSHWQCFHSLSTLPTLYIYYLLCWSIVK